MEDEISMAVLHNHCVYTHGICAGEVKRQRWCRKLYYCLLLLTLLNRCTLPPSQSARHTEMWLPAHTMQTCYLLGLQSSWPWHDGDLTPCKGLGHEHRAWIVPVPASAKYGERIKPMALEVQEYQFSHWSSITLSPCSTRFEGTMMLFSTVSV